MERTKHGKCENVARTYMYMYMFVGLKFFGIIVAATDRPLGFGMGQPLNNYDNVLS